LRVGYRSLGPLEIAPDPWDGLFVGREVARLSGQQEAALSGLSSPDSLVEVADLFQDRVDARDISPARIEPREVEDRPPRL
jgi:hypothetical protein